MVVGFVAGIAIGGRTLVNAVDVTLFAFKPGVLSFKFERGEIVIEFCRFPGFRFVAGCTVRTELPGMRIIAAMTEDTIGGCIFEVGERSCVGVTFGTDQAGMPAAQFE